MSFEIGFESETSTTSWIIAYVPWVMLLTDVFAVIYQRCISDQSGTKLTEAA